MLRAVLGVFLLSGSIALAAELPQGGYVGNGENANLEMFVEDGWALLTLTGRGCIGSLEGRIAAVDEGRWEIVANDEGTSCTIVVSRESALQYSVQQGSGCSYYHGAACGFSGWLRRAK